MKATLVFPTMIAPACLSRRATVASESATKSAKAGLPQVVCIPATLKLSLIVMGTPCSGPASSPRAVASSAATASCNAASRRSSTTAFSAGLTDSIRVSSIPVIRLGMRLSLRSLSRRPVGEDDDARTERLRVDEFQNHLIDPVREETLPAPHDYGKD